MPGNDACGSTARHHSDDPFSGSLESPRVIDAGDRPDDVVGGRIDRHEIGQHPAVALVVEEVRRHLDHVAAGIDAVDRLGVLDGAQPPHRESARAPPAGAVVGQPQPVGMRRVEEQLLRRQRQRHVGIAQVQRDVAPSRRLLPQRLRQFRQVGESMGEQQPPPAAIDRDVLRHSLLIGMLLVLCVPVAQRRRIAALQTVPGAGVQGLSSSIRCRVSGASIPKVPPATAWSRAGE